MAQDPGAGVAIPAGGSGRLAEALVALLTSLGGEIHTGSRATKMLVRGKTARAVQLAEGTTILARRAVVACLTPAELFLELVGLDHLPGEFVERVRKYRHGVSVLRLELAPAEAPAWAAGEEVRQAGAIHLAPSFDHMSLAPNQALSGYLPEEPLLVVGHPNSIDSARAPGNSGYIAANILLR